MFLLIFSPIYSFATHDNPVVEPEFLAHATSQTNVTLQYLKEIYL